MRLSLVGVLALAFVIACSGGNGGKQNVAQAQQPPLGNNNGVCNAGNGNGNVIQGAPCAPTPTPAVATPAPMRDLMTWFCGVTFDLCNSTTAQIAQYADWCQGNYAGTQFGGTTHPVAYPSACPKSFIYTSANIGEPDVNGKDTDFPFHGSVTAAPGQTAGSGPANCPSVIVYGQQTTGNFWAQQGTWNGNPTPDYNSSGSNRWVITLPVGTPGNVNSFGGSWSPHYVFYFFYTNLSSATMLAFIQAQVKYCEDAYGDILNNYTGSFEDNSYAGSQSHYGDVWDNYANNRNFGGTTGTGLLPVIAPYFNAAFANSSGAFNPTTFFASISTTTNTNITGGAATTVTPASMTNIIVGKGVAIGTDYAIVSAVTSTTFTATFASSHTCTTACTIKNGPQTTSAQLTSSDFPATYPNDTSFTSGTTNLLQCCTHLDGTTPWWFLVNFGFNVNQTYLQQSHTLGQTAEEFLHGYCSATSSNSSTVGPTYCQSQGAIGMPYGMREALSLEAATYDETLAPGKNPNAHVIFLDDQPVTGTYAAGSASHQQNLRWHYAAVLAGENDTFPNMIVSQENSCAESNTLPNCMDIWAGDYLKLYSRVTPMPADPLGAASQRGCGEYGSGSSYNFSGCQVTQNGAHDANIRCGAVADAYCFEFNNSAVYGVTASGACATISRANYTTCEKSTGAAALLVNNSGTNLVLSTANLSAWFPHVWSGISSGNVVAFCQPTSNYFAWLNGGTTYTYLYSSGTTPTAVCSGNTGNDVPEWSGVAAPFDIPNHSTPLSTVLNTTLTNGQMLVITAQ